MTQVPSARGIRAYSDWVTTEPVITWWMQRDWNPAWQISQVLSEATKEAALAVDKRTLNF